jgi:hypothetical protein
MELNYEVTHVIINSAASNSFYIGTLPGLSIFLTVSWQEQNARTSFIYSSTNCLSIVFGKADSIAEPNS